MTVSPLQKTRWSALALIVTAQFMVILDVAIVNVALPSIQSDLGFSDATIQWVVSAYAIFFGGVLLLGGRLADLFGRRRLFMGGLALFGATSLAVRARLVGGLADHVSRASGPGGRPDGTRRARAADDDVRRGPRAQPRARDLRRGVRQRRGGGGAARRRAHLVPALVVDLLHQRAGRGRRDRAHAGAAAREPREPPAPPLRSRRCGVDHGGADAARLRAHARDDRRLGRAAHDRPARCLGRADRRVHRDRAPLAAAAPAAADLPAPDARRLERDHAARRRGHVLGVLRALAVRAGRPALHGGADRRSRSRHSRSRSSSSRTSPRP